MAGAVRRLILLLLFLMGLVDMVENVLPICQPSTYTTNSTFDHNLQRLLASLVANSSLTNYYNTTVGKGGDQVHGTIACRADIDGDVCQICAADAASQIVRLCPNKREALLSAHHCIMYYFDANFTIPDSVGNIALPSPGAIPNPNQFKPQLLSFLQKLAASAIVNPSGRFFWGDKFRYQNKTIYVMVECTPFLSQVACKSCLEEAIVRMMNRYAESVGGVVYNKGVCYVRYEAMISFFPPLLQTIDLNRANYISRNCSAAAPINLTGTAYHRNLKTLLVSLTEKGPLTGYTSQVFGQSPDQVYGQFLCRGDVSDDVCWTCAGQASAKLLQLCPNSKKAIVWLDYCQLRYSDLNLEGVVDVNDKACQPDPENAPTPTSFDRTLRDLLSSLTSYATHENSSVPLFATGASKHHEIYGLVQCSRDISPEQCGRCLQNAVSDIAECANGKQGARILRGSCRLAYGTQPFFLGQPMLVSIGQGEHNHKPWWIFLIIGATSLALLAAACALCLLWVRRRHLEKLKYNVEADDDVGNTTEEADHDLPHISLWAIQDATNNFSEANKLGEGGFGPVYKGKLPDEQEVAVKRLARASGQGVREFKNEVKLIAKLQHTNLVRLIGCCLEKREKLLVYEFMPNKSLDYFLKDLDHSVLLDWEKRFNIIMGIARGILYLHQDSRLNIIHRDLKAGNVLLDEQMNPKISDFGMARTFTGVHGQATTSTVVGTYGYMAPEYALDGIFSTKSDVYSFGILLLEIICGQLNSKFQLSHPDQNLIVHAWRLWSEGNVSEFIDPILRSTSSINEVERCMQMGLLCIQEDAATRPTMSTVVLMLGNSSLALPVPKAPAYSQIISTSAQSSPQLSSLPIPSPTPR